MTLDVGFANIQAYPPSQYPGFIVLRPSSQETPKILEIGARLVRALQTTSVLNELWVVSDDRIRRRR